MTGRVENSFLLATTSIIPKGSYITHFKSFLPKQSLSVEKISQIVIEKKKQGQPLCFLSHCFYHPDYEEIKHLWITHLHCRVQIQAGWELDKFSVEILDLLAHGVKVEILIDRAPVQKSADYLSNFVEKGAKLIYMNNKYFPYPTAQGELKQLNLETMVWLPDKQKSEDIFFSARVLPRIIDTWSTDFKVYSWLDEKGKTRGFKDQFFKILRVISDGQEIERVGKSYFSRSIFNYLFRVHESSLSYQIVNVIRYGISKIFYHVPKIILTYLFSRIFWSLHKTWTRIQRLNLFGVWLKTKYFKSLHRGLIKPYYFFKIPN